MKRGRIVAALFLAFLIETVGPSSNSLAHGFNPRPLFRQAAADLDAASTFVERSTITEQTPRLVISRTVIAEYDQTHGSERIHAYETRRSRTAHGSRHVQTRYLDIIFLGSRRYVRTTPSLRWRAYNGSQYTDTGWRDSYTNAAPSFGDLPAADLRMIGSANGEAHLRLTTADVSADLWISTASPPYLVRYRARYDREVGGQRGTVQEDSRFYGFNHPLKIVVPIH